MDENQEKANRLKYQGIVYQLCCIVDSYNITCSPCTAEEVISKLKIILGKRQEPTGRPEDIMSKIPVLEKDTIEVLKNCDLTNNK